MTPNGYTTPSRQGKELRLISSIILFLPLLLLSTLTAQSQVLTPEARRQINYLLAEKAARTPAQKKIDSHILLLYKSLKDKNIKANLPQMDFSDIKQNAGKVKVDITATVDAHLLDSLKKLNCEIIFSSEAFHNVVANVPLLKLEQVASLSAVKHIALWTEPVHGDMNRTEESADSAILPVNKTDFPTRAANVSNQLKSILTNAAGDSIPFTGKIVSEAVVTHKVDSARLVFGVTGAGIKIGVLSDGVAGYDSSQSSGDLPAVIHILPGQAGAAGQREGRAMMELIHDIAPDAELYFATATISKASFAQNILDLRAAGCDIIVDDVGYFDEGVFQDDIVAQSITRVINDGGLYFSSAGNGGNKNDGTGSVWEGDFIDGGTDSLFPGGTINNFGGGNLYNTITPSNVKYLCLKWSDPLGASGNDYDLFLTNSAGSAIYSSSTDVQDGDDDPFETVYSGSSNKRVYIVKKTGAAVRALHLNGLRSRLGITTPGAVYGHSGSANAFSIAATPVSPNYYIGYPAGPYPGTFNDSNAVELFSSDGPRRMFYNPDGTAITPGNILFGTNGGTLLQKPDFTAADGAVTATPNFARFFGTSAAAPNAAAITALLKSKFPGATPQQITNCLTTTAIDIETPGVDRDAGAGIIMAYEAMQKYATDYAQGCPVYSLNNISVVQPDCTSPGGTITINDSNNGVSLEYSIDGKIYQPSNVFTNVAPGDYSITAREQLGNFNCTAKSGSWVSIKAYLPVTVRTSTVSYIGSPVSVPDNQTTGVNIPLTVSGQDSILTDINFRLDADPAGGCDATSGNKHASVDNTATGDLVFKLISPSGKLVTLIQQVGEDGNNFCTVLLDDSSSRQIQSVTSSSSPISGYYAPANPLSAFNGENPNGTWTLNVSDVGPADTGSVRRFSLIIGSAPYHCPPQLSPLVNVTPFESCQGTGLPSAVQSFTAAGTNLYADLTVKTSFPFEISADSTSGFGDSISLAPVGGIVNKTLYARMKPIDYNFSGAAYLSFTTQGTYGFDLNLNGSSKARQTWYRDADSDGFGDLATSLFDCHQPAGYVADSTDCNDNDSGVHVPILYYHDYDLDGWGGPDTIYLCTSKPGSMGYQRENLDCDDHNRSISPETQWVLDADGDKYYTASIVQQCLKPGNGYVIYNRFDYQPGDCNDNNAAVNPGATEICGNGVDDNCNGQVDEGCTAPLTVKASSTAASACGNDGTVTLRASAGKAPYQYSLDDVTYTSSNTFMGLAAGSYTGYAKDSRGAAGTVPVTVSKTADLAVTSTAVNASACLNDGKITLRRTGGKAPFSYSLDGVAYTTTNVFTGLAAGSYTGYVKDGKGCTATQQNIVVGKQPAMAVSYTKVNATRCPSNGSITLKRTGGTSPFTYSLNGNTFVSTAKFSNLSPGTYTGYVKDGKGCVAMVGGITITGPSCSSNLIASGIENKIVPAPSVAVSPNPARSQLRVLLSGFEGKVLIQIFDVDGRQVRQQNSTVKSGSVQQTFDVSTLPSGSYLLVVSDEKSNRKTEKFVVSR